ncbi:hypothetical protein [Piscirickettsia salmonis]|uniref:hypothetical protein n=1 Tax=Piscirickettsia salmonis TaxID=1238 RepID=UPI0012B8323B|nr:hypothetical protein [Piscirickettsia salmonis]
MLGDFASLDVQNTYRGSDAYVLNLNCLFFYKLFILYSINNIFYKKCNLYCFVDGCCL